MKQSGTSILTIFLLTSATIIFEISLSRLFSYMLSFHFVLIIIAFSILGLGLGQIIYSRHSLKFDRSSLWWSVLPAFTMSVSFLLMLVLPKAGLTSVANLGLLAFILIAIVPFISIGLLYARLFEANKQAISYLYAADFVGAATGALLTIFLLNVLSLTAVVAVAVLLLLAAFTIQALVQKNRYSRAILFLFILVLPVFWIAKDSLDIDITIANNPSKDMLRLTNHPAVKSKLLESRWNAFGKTDLVQLTYPDQTESMTMFIDGAAGTGVVNIDELLEDTVKIGRAIGRFPALFAMNFLEDHEKDTALIIGPGGGIDIAAAYFSGFDFIEAAEVNPSFVELMQTYNRPTFSDRENIKVWVREGRNFVREGIRKYDAIFLTIPVTKSTRGADFYGLTENYLFTVEALADYLEGLTEEGAIFFTMHARQEVYKMLSNYLELMRQRGTKQEEAFKSIYIFSNGMNPVLVIRKAPFNRREIEKIHLAAHMVSMDEDVFFFPYIRQISGDTVVRNVNYDWYMFDDLLYDVSTGEYPQRELWESSLINLDPVTDDRPYFFNYNAGIPDVMAVPLWLALFIVGWFLFNWLRRWKSVTLTEHPGLNIRQRFCNLALIAFLLGFSYFFIQAYLFQILNLKLSSPSKSFSLLLFSFLLGNGLGSLLTKWFKRALTKKLMAYTAMIVIANLLTVLVLLPISYDQLSELGIAGFLLFPAFFIGIPFPLLLRMGAKISDKRTVALLLGISSVAGVAASILAIVISILYGYKAVFIIGLILYGIAAMVTFRLRKLQIQQHKHQFI